MNIQAVSGLIFSDESLHKYSYGAPVNALRAKPTTPNSMA